MLTSVVEDQSLLAPRLQQGFDRSVLKLNNLLLTFIDEAAECGKQKVPGLEQEGHVQRRYRPVLIPAG